MSKEPARSPSRSQQVLLWAFASVLGLAIASIVGAGAVASIGLVALVGIILGFGFAATQRTRGSSERDPN